LVAVLHGGVWWWFTQRPRVAVTAVEVPPMVEVEWVTAAARPEPPAASPPAPVAPVRKAEPKPKPAEKAPVKPLPKKVEAPKAKPAPAAAETDDLAQRLKNLRESLGPAAPAKAEAAARPAPSRAPSKAVGSGAHPTEKTSTARADHLHNPKPPYPAVARARNWEGVSRLRVYVLPNGTAGQVQLAGSSGHEVLDSAALAAVKGWRFVPAKRGDQAIASWVQFPIVWKLQ
jgi:protein TonB